MATNIKRNVKVVKSESGVVTYMGCIRIFENGKFSWGTSSRINRLNPTDAMLDAIWMTGEIEGHPPIIEEVK